MDAQHGDFGGVVEGSRVCRSRGLDGGRVTGDILRNRDQLFHFHIAALAQRLQAAQIVRAAEKQGVVDRYDPPPSAASGRTLFTNRADWLS